jgi:AmmeMemoRadiSam system protein A
MKQEHKDFLLKLARNTIRNKLFGTSEKLECPADNFYQEKRGAFVTLHKHKQLRGCIGFIEGIKPIYDIIKEIALAAAFQDPRFPALQKDELEKIEIEISILTPLKEVKSKDDIKIGKHGLLIRNGFNSGLLLPQVATEWNWDVETFLQQTCLKAGLNTNCWQDKNSTIYRFSAQIFSESRKKS